MSEGALLTERDGHVLIVTINRPDKRNAVNAEVLCGLADAWARLRDDDELRVAVLTGAGGDFCAGMDLSVIPKLARRQADDAFERRLLDDTGVIFDGWLKTNRPDKPIVAAVEGYALAGGTEILQGTDIRVAAENARFGVTEVQRSLFPMAGSSVRLPRQIPYTVAAEMLLTGEAIDARRAFEVGLVGHLVPPGRALETALRLARRIARNGPLAVRAILRTLRETAALPEDRAFEIEMRRGMEVMASEDAREGPRAFLEKREPVFRGR